MSMGNPPNPRHGGRDGRPKGLNVRLQKKVVRWRRKAAYRSKIVNVHGGGVLPNSESGYHKSSKTISTMFY